MANKTFEKLFDEFPPVSTEQWEAIIEKDLKGAPYDKKLIWRTLEGINLRPYYRAEDLENLPQTNNLPGEAPFIRGSKTNNNDWEIQQNIQVSDIKKANAKALEVLNKGITSLNFQCCAKNCTCTIQSPEDISALLKDIRIDCVETSFACGCTASTLLDLLIGEVGSRSLTAENIHGKLGFDPLGKLTQYGNWYLGEENDFNTMADLVKKAKSTLPNYKVIKISACYLHNGGANIIQELAFTLAMANEYFTRAEDKDIAAGDLAKHLNISLGIGSNYFMEIAKLRALRVLWSKMMEAYNATGDGLYLHCNTSGINQTIYDAHNNILRGTTEAMSAVIGGCNSLHIKPFDASFKETDGFSERIARNIQIILKEEAYFDKIVDPSAGSYYIETITDSLIEEAWKLFLEVEEKGGYLECLKTGFIQLQIKDTAAKRNQRIAQRRDVLVGTNQYPHYSEFKQNDIDASIAFPGVKNGKTVVEPIEKIRIGAAFEKLRLQTEASGKQPVVFMLTYGNLAMRKARATFSANFFACAGYKVIDNLGFKTIDDGVKAAMQAKADVVVLCSSDDEYPELAPQAFKLLKDKSVVVVAGSPACMDDLKAKGLEHFIHMRSNILETLQNFNALLGL